MTLLTSSKTLDIGILPTAAATLFLPASGQERAAHIGNNFVHHDILHASHRAWQRGIRSDSSNNRQSRSH
jgi:hypothetical protein